MSLHVSAPIFVPSSGYVTNRYNGIEGWSMGATDTLVLTANRFYAAPFICRYPATFTRIGLEVTTGAAGGARVGIYRAAAGVPTSLVVDSGALDTTNIAKVEGTISTSLSVGMYFLAVVSNATATVRASAPTAAIPQAYIGGPAPDGGSANTHFYRSFTYAALPDPFGGSLTYTNANMPGLWLRVV